MSETNGVPQKDIHQSAARLYHELQHRAWFTGVEVDEEHGKLIVLAKDLAAGREWCQATYDGFPVIVERGKGVVYRKAATEIVVQQDASDGGEMIS